MPETKVNASRPARDHARLAFAALIAANIALAFGPWFVRASGTGPVAAGFWRITLAAPLLFGASLAAGWHPRAVQGRLIPVIAIGGLCFAADLASWHIGILRTTLANATLFGNSTTLIFPIYGFIVARTLPTRMQGIALLLAALGAGLLLGRSYEVSPDHLIGDLLCLLAGLLYTVYFIAMQRVRAVMAPLPALMLSTLASIVPLLLMTLAFGERLWPDHWGVLIGLALVSQVLGQGMMTYALGRLSPLVIGIGLLVQPIVSATIGWIVYDERLGTTELAGAIMVAAALVLVRRSR
ncbi:MAG: DMT family transporter [Sphingomonas sp.]|jgi:drug/metabolite transporter (DMT)-like permease